MSADRIERETFIEAPRERVWTVLTEAQHLGRWFGDAGAEIDLRPGGAMTLSWEEHGTAYAVVEAVDEPHRFAYRWAVSQDPDDLDFGPGGSTLVEFTLAAEGDGTRLRVVESGFAGLELPDPERVERIEDNTDGWRIQLGNVADYLQREASLR